MDEQQATRDGANSSPPTDRPPADEAEGFAPPPPPPPGALWAASAPVSGAPAPVSAAPVSDRSWPGLCRPGVQRF